jgi:DNA-binding MarR family transcriptional regulator
MSGDQRPGEPLSDEEYSELGKTIGMLFRGIMRARKEPEGGQISVLMMLSKCGPVRSSDLAKELFLDQSTVSRHVAHLEADGLVEKVADPTDRRATKLHLTDLGRKHVQDFWQQRIEAMREGFEHWDPEELRTLSRLVARYVEDFGAMVAKNTQSKNPTTAPTTNGPTTEDGSADE